MCGGRFSFYGMGETEHVLGQMERKTTTMESEHLKGQKKKKKREELMESVSPLRKVWHPDHRISLE